MRDVLRNVAVIGTMVSTVSKIPKIFFARAFQFFCDKNAGRTAIFWTEKREGKKTYCGGGRANWGANPFGVVDRILAILNRKIDKNEKSQEYNFSRNINS